MKRCSSWESKVRTASWGTALSLTIVLVLALQGGNVNLLWGAAPLALLALADAGYAAQARRIAEFGRRLNGQKGFGAAGRDGNSLAPMPSSLIPPDNPEKTGSKRRAY